MYGHGELYYETFRLRLKIDYIDNRWGNTSIKKQNEAVSSRRLDSIFAKLKLK